MESKNLMLKSNSNNNIEIPEMTPFNTRMEAKFLNLQSDVEYKFTICTIINGKSISKRLITLKQEN